MNAIELLKSDHDQIRDLLNKLSETTSRAVKSRQDLLSKIERELSAHTRIEEEIFYPVFRERAEKAQQQMYHEAREEHRAVEALVLPDLKQTKPDSDTFSGRAKVLKELVEHHAEEEEQEMFPLVKKLMSSEELDTLGEQMAERKQKLLQR